MSVIRSSSYWFSSFASDFLLVCFFVLFDVGGMGDSILTKQLMGGDPILQKKPIFGIELVETPALDRHS